MAVVFLIRWRMFTAPIFTNSESYFYNPFIPANQIKYRCKQSSNQPSHPDLHCLPLNIHFLTVPLFASVRVSKFDDEIFHFSNSGMKGLYKFALYLQVLVIIFFGKMSNRILWHRHLKINGSHLVGKELLLAFRYVFWLIVMGTQII